MSAFRGMRIMRGKRQSEREDERMEIRFGGSSFLIIGTPEEVNEFVRINTEQTEPVVEQVEIPEAPKKKTRQKAVDWAKAIALRKAGWTYDAIASELHVGKPTVVNHMKTMGV